MVTSVAEPNSEQYVDPFRVRLELDTSVGDVKTMVVKQSQQTATPLPENFQVELRLLLGDRTVLDNSRQLGDYADEFDLDAPGGYLGIFTIVNKTIGAPLS